MYHHYKGVSQVIDEVNYARAFKTACDLMEGANNPLLVKAAATVLYKTMIAVAYSDCPTKMNPSGGIVNKTRKLCQIERERLDVLIDVLAEWPGMPFGRTKFAVEETVRMHLYGVDESQVWQTAQHSLAHRV